MMRRFFKFTMLFGAIIGSMESCSKLDKVRPVAENMAAIKSLSVDMAAPSGATVNFTKTVVVTTVAGNGIRGTVNGPGSSAEFTLPAGVAIDATGNLYVADFNANLIRKITPAGLASTFAGDGSFGFADGQGVAAKFYSPVDVKIDASGNILVADAGNNRIRKITAAGLVSTIAGSTRGFTDGAIASAKFSAPEGLAIDAAGNIYVADAGNDRIRKITPSGNVSTLAGNGISGFADGPGTVAQFRGPAGVAVDASGNVYVGDQNNNRIRKITPSGNVSTLAGNGIQGAVDGPGTSAEFYFPAGLTVDASGNVYVAGYFDMRIRKITPAGTVSTLAGNGTPGAVDGVAAAAEFSSPQGVAVDPSGNLYVADRNNNMIRKITITEVGVVSTLAGSGIAGNSNGTGTGAQFNLPAGAGTDVFGNIYIADQGNQRIRKITTAGVVSTLAGRIGGFADGAANLSRFNAPTGVVADTSGNVYVADQINHRIRKITTAGVVSTLAGSGIRGFADGPGTAAQFNYPYGLAIDNSDNLYVADADNNRIRKITPAGLVSTLAGDGIAGFADGTGTLARFSSPVGVAIDAFGNLYVADRRNNRIRKITTTGTVSTLAGSAAGFADGAGTLAKFNLPSGVAADASGNVYVTDQGNQRIRKITPAGEVSSPAGSGTAGYVDGTGSLAMFNNPLGIAVNNSGSLIICDQNNNVIRAIH